MNKLSTIDVMRLCVKFSLDKQTIRKRARGLPVRGQARERADKALRSIGIEPGSLASLQPEAAAMPAGECRRDEARLDELERVVAQLCERNGIIFDPPEPA